MGKKDDLELHDETTALPRRGGRRRGWAIAGVLALIAITGAAGNYAWRLRGEYVDLLHERNGLRRQNQSLSDALELHRTSAANLDTQLATCKEDLSSEKQVRTESTHRATQLEIALSSCEDNMTNLEQQRAEAKARLQEFQEITARFQSMIDTGKLDVAFRRGQMIVKLPAAILFPSGSAQVSEGGKKALAEVAAVLKDMPRRRFTIAGHTDSIPIHSEEFASNWELSTARAVAVTKSLIENGIRPKNLVAAGYGPYAPITSNESKQGRQRNRRIEIILEPNLHPLRELASRNDR